MSFIPQPTLIYGAPTTVEAYEVDPKPGGGRRFHVDIRSPGVHNDALPRRVMSFAGDLYELHDLFLAMHSALSEAAENDIGRGVHHLIGLEDLGAGLVDEGPGADGVGLGGGEAGDVDGGLFGDGGAGA